MTQYAAVGATTSSSNPADLSYKESEVDIKLQLSLWHPNKYSSSVAFLSDNNGDNEIVEAMLREIQEFLCLETRWMVVASVQDVGHDHCYDIRHTNSNNAPTKTTTTTTRNSSNRRNLLRHVDDSFSSSTSLRTLQDEEEAASVEGSSSSSSSSIVSGSGGGNDIIVVLKDPQLMIKDENMDGSISWTSWTLQYSVLETSPQLSEEQFYGNIQTTTQKKLDLQIESGYLEDEMQSTLPGAMLSVIGQELETFLGVATGDVVTATPTTATHDTSTGVVPLAPPVQESSNTNGDAIGSVVDVVENKNFDPESYFLVILGTLMLLATLCLTYLLVSLSRKRFMERRNKIIKQRKRTRPTDIINLHECPSL